MIKQTATYGVWKVDRHDDNKVEVYKNGELCEKSTPALREIAAEIGLELNPEWRTSQLGANVLKAMLNAGEEKPQVSETKEAVVASKPKEKTLEEMSIKELSELYKAKKLPIDAKDGDINKALYEVFQNLIPGFIIPQTETKPVEEVTPETDKPKYDVNSVENSEEFCKNDPDIQAFYKEWKSYTKEQFDALLNAANNGDVIAQYKCGYMYKDAARQKFILECAYIEENRLKSVQDDLAALPKYIDLDKAEEEAVTWLLAASKQGLGIAMYELASLYCYGPKFNINGARRWIGEGEKICPWRGWGFLYHPAYYDVDKHLKERVILDKKVHEQEKELEKSQERIDKIKKQYEEVFDKHNEVVRQYNELIDDYNKLVRQVKKDRSDYNKLVDKYQNLEDEYESASSSSSNSDEVRVKISYKTPGFFGSSNNTKYVNMTQDEYKALLKGSMKSRIAYVYGNCGVSRLLDVSDVSISLA